MKLVVTFETQEEIDEYFEYLSYKKTKELAASDPLYQMGIDTLDFTVRTNNSLLAEGVATVGRLLEMTEIDILKIPNLGVKSLREIKDMLSARDLPPLGSRRKTL